MTNPSRIWPTGHYDDQFSHVAPKDSLACVSFSSVHCFESMNRYFFGDYTEYSNRYVAYMSNTTAQGNTLTKVVNTIKQFGLVKEEDWPEPYTFTWEEFYSPVPDSVIKKGKEWTKQWTISDPVEIAPNKVNDALLNGPLVVFLPSGTPIHAEEVISPTQVFNSYPPYLLDYPNSIYKFYQFIIKPKKMSNAIFVHKAGTPEYGFYIPAKSDDAIRDKALNLGLNVLKLDGTTDFSLAKDVTGL